MWAIVLLGSGRGTGTEATWFRGFRPLSEPGSRVLLAFKLSSAQRFNTEQEALGVQSILAGIDWPCRVVDLS